MPKKSNKKQITSRGSASGMGTGATTIQPISGLVVLGIFVILLFEFRLLFQLNIHWDEFHFLSLIYDRFYSRLETPYQSFHTLLFYWLTRVGGNEIRQVILGRCCMFLCSCLSIFFLFRIARRHFSREASLFVVFVVLSSSSQILFMSSFRYDPLLACCSMTALYFLLFGEISSVRQIFLGVLFGLLFAISLKAALLLVWLGCLYLFSRSEEEGRWRRLIVFLKQGLLGVIVAYGIFLLFTPYVTQEILPVVSTTPTEMIHGFLFQGRAPSAEGAFPDFILQNPAHVFFFLLSIYFLIRDMITKRKYDSAFFLTLALGIVLLLFYRNAFPYFYICVVPFMSLLTGIGFEQFLLIPHLRRSYQFGVNFVCFLLLAIPAYQHFRSYENLTLASQREVIEAVHEMYPYPVPYLDRGGMIASFPMVGPFMSSWVMARYAENQQIGYAEILSQKHPEFLLQNISDLELRNNVQGFESASLQEMKRILKENFIPFWGPIAVPGKRFSECGKQKFALLISGDYLLQASSPVSIDSKRWSDAAIISLASGEHELDCTQATPVTLRWASPHLPSAEWSIHLQPLYVY